MDEWKNEQERVADATEQNTDMPAQQPTEQPAEQPAQQPTEQPAEQPVQQPVQQPAQQPVQQPFYQQPPVMPPVQNGMPPYRPNPTVSYRPPYTQPPMQQTPPPPPKKSKGDRVPIIILAVLCSISILMMGGMMVLIGVTQGDENGNSGSNNQQSGTTTTTASGDLKDSQDQPNMGAADPNAPSVNINDTPQVSGDAAEADGGLLTEEIVNNNLDSTVMLTMYQKNSYGGYFGYGDGNELTEVGGATGIIYSSDGRIITNSHCVFNEDTQRVYDRLVVTLYNGEEYDAKVAGYDPITDLAVIKIEATGLQVAEFGNSSKLSLGERVVTLGNSGGLAWSASQGIVSGLARDVYEDTGYEIQCLQVDAVINPGSSGGPLFNKYGQVVGINSAKIVSQGYEGLGFSIPINEAKSVIEDLAQHGYVRNRVSLKIMGNTVTSIGYEGFYIESIDEDSPLKGTNAQKGDIITHVDGERVMDYTELRAQLTSHNVGDEVTLTLIRVNRSTRKVEEFTVTVKLAESR